MHSYRRVSELEASVKALETKLVRNEMASSSKVGKLERELAKQKRITAGTEAKVLDLQRQLEIETKEYEALAEAVTSEQTKRKDFENKTVELQEVLNFKQDELDKKKVRYGAWLKTEGPTNSLFVCLE